MGVLKLMAVVDRFIDSILNNLKPSSTAEEGREITGVMEMTVEGLHQKYDIY